MTRAWPTHDGVMTIGGLPVTELAAKYDTPCYITDGERIQGNYRQLAAAFAPYGPIAIAYACKANTALAVLKLLDREGAAIDAVSIGECHLALKAGFAPDRIHFTGTNPRDDELDWLLEHGVEINLDSLSMARRIVGKCKNTAFGVRINPNVGAGHHEHVVTGAEETKFGVHPEQLPELCQLLAQHGHQLVRLHAHIGSGVLEPTPFLELITAFHRVARELEGEPGVALHTIDLGGGIGIPYRPGEPALDVQRLANEVGTRFRECFGAEVMLMLEPGRYLVADSTVLLTRVNSLKDTPKRHYVGVDAGFQTLLRPVLYGAYHHVVAATKMNQRATEQYSICGPICETGDVFGHERELPPLEEGDLLAICDAGAYGFVMASNYNSRPRPPEVMVLGGADYLIRERETFAVLTQGQHIPDPLTS